MRAALVVVALSAVASLTASGCGKTRACTANTVLLHVDGAAADGADTLSLDITIGAGSPKTVTVAWKQGGGSVEIDFPAGYPRGQVVTITATASQAGATLASASDSITLADSCEALSLTLPGGSGDGGTCVPTLTSCPATTVCGKVDDGCGTLLDCGSPCQVNSADRVVASAGDVITLEGKFADPTIVTFPGGATATATALGANRVTVAVPASAGEGALTVQSGTVAAGSLPFRRSPYVPDVQPFRGSYEQVDYAHQLSGLNQSRYWTTAVAGDKYVYVIGGNGSSTTATTVEQAMINADGSIGALVQSPNTMVVKRAFAAAARLGNYLYVFGGNDANDGGTAVGTVTNTVERAAIGADGTLGTFALVSGVTLKASLQVATNTYNGLWGHSLAIIGNWLYIFGGNLGPFCSPMATAQIERAPILPDGTIGDFALIATPLMAAEAHGAAVVSGGFVYVVGPGNKIQASPITPTGDLSGFVDSGVTLPGNGAGPHGAAYAIGSQLFLIGGMVSSVNGAIVKIPIATDGTLGTPVLSPFTMLTANNMAGIEYNFGSALIGHYIYAFGGGDSNTCSAAFITVNRTVQRASLDGSGKLGPFTSLPTINPTVERDELQAVTIGNHVYAIGGQGAGMPDLDVANVQPDGTLSNFTASTVSLMNHRSGAMAAVVGANLYVIGGTAIGDATSYQLGVESAVISPDGSLGAFDKAKINGTGAPLVLNLGRSFGVAFVVPGERNNFTVVNDTLCVTGGATPSSAVEVDCATINPDGTLAGSFAVASPAATLLIARINVPSAYVSDRAYVLAGNPMSTTTIEAAPFDLTTGKLSGTFATSVALSNQDAFRAGWSFGSVLYMSGGSTGLGSFAADIQTSALSGTGAPAAFTTSSVTLNFGRGGHRAVVIGAKVYVFGGRGQLGAADTEVAELR